MIDNLYDLIAFKKVKLTVPSFIAGAAHGDDYLDGGDGDFINGWSKAA